MKKNPLLILAVGDPLLTREALEKKLAGAQDAVYRFYAKDADWTAVLEQARTFPFLSEKQVIWIKQAELVDEETVELLDKYFENPAPFTTFLFETESFAGKKKFTDWVSSTGGEVIQFESESKWKKQTEQVRSFIREKLKALKLTATPGAVKMLEDSCGEHFILLDNNLEILSLKAGINGQIAETDVEVLVDEMDDRTGFDLAEALASKQMSKVFQIYFNLYEDNPYQSGELLGLLNWQIRRIYEGKKLVKKGASKQELASKLRMSPYFIDRFITNMQAFDERKLKNAFGYLMETDEDIKTGKVAVGAALETLLLRLGLS